jgi:hypothetical protein
MYRLRCRGQASFLSERGVRQALVQRERVLHNALAIKPLARIPFLVSEFRDWFDRLRGEVAGLVSTYPATNTL